ncbi:3-hydroxyacyl-CoA dehydrogenase [Xanthobacter sp. KR7-65]|uniref:3-hydroxyacyl-CoA dehydrogenase n=1 Tax=Xanthobacter sp. KR7-65 TaxID=3156612 RepID=UPI0032B530AA
MTDSTIGIVGAGIMGRGIAQVAAEAGMGVRIADAAPGKAAEAAEACAAMIRRKVDKGQAEPAAAAAAIARITATDAGPQAGYGAFAGCDLVVEAVVERLEVKQQVLAGLEAAVGEDCILATNTSSLSVTALAAGARRPGRVAGFHFFNPVPLMRVVEVIGGALTDEAVVERLIAIARRMGHQPVRATDTPGFVVNHAGRGYLTEALRIVSEGIAAFADVDRVMTQAAGFRLGPFELLDLTGLDVSVPVMDAIYHQYYEEPRYRPSVLAATRQAGGLLGRKSGRGFYDYPGGKIARPQEPPPPGPPAGQTAWISPVDAAAKAALGSILVAAGAELETGPKPSPEAIAFVTPWGDDCGTAALAEGLDPRQVVAVDPSTLGPRLTLMASPATDPAVRRAAHGLLAAGGAAMTLINDSPGFIAQRIHAAIVNVGSDMAQQRVAAPEEIDLAVELGLGYPRGPLRLGDAMGPARVLHILERMGAFYADPRYRPSPWLKRRARLGLSLQAPD